MIGKVYVRKYIRYVVTKAEGDLVTFVREEMYDRLNGKALPLAISFNQKIDVFESNYKEPKDEKVSGKYRI